MARPKNIQFYEIPISQLLPESREWLHEFHEHSKKLVDYMKAKGAGHTACHTTVSCLTELREYLLENDIPYSPDNARKWYDENINHTKGYQVTLHRLSDLFGEGGIQPVNAYPQAVPYTKRLNSLWKGLLSGFLKTLKLSASSAEQVRNCVARFLYHVQENGINTPSGISFEFLEMYCQTDGHRSKNSYARYIYAIGDILLFMADKGLCSYGLGWYPYFRMHGRIFKIQDLTKSQRNRLEKIRSESLDFSTERVAGLIPDFLENFSAAGYSESPCTTARFTLNNLLLFLEMHGFGYHKDIADIWLEHYRSINDSKGWKQARRVLRLFDMYIREGRFVLHPFFREKELLCDSLPVWCKAALYEYMESKAREGWEKSTLDMIRSSVTRFCRYLADLGLTGFSEVNADILKEFNLADKHQTAEGKNAYNGRIRKFIKFLERKEILPYGIHQGLMATAAPKEKIVVVLTQDEREVIDKKYKVDGISPVELRDRAIMMLGLKMGLRASDIVTIRLSDIDWNRQTLRIIQEKTDNEILLPLPTVVGNSIYLYLKKGRPNKKTSSDYLFIKNRVPYDSLCRGVCADALERLLPDRNVPGSAFHVTRKTYATDCLKKGIGKQGIADLLGHRDTQSLHHYLQFDEEKMRMCPLSLAETGLLMKGGRYGNL